MYCGFPPPPLARACREPPQSHQLVLEKRAGEPSAPMPVIFHAED
jgi:hypothetical protein